MDDFGAPMVLTSPEGLLVGRTKKSGGGKKRFVEDAMG